jgi:hypothetical protein
MQKPLDRIRLRAQAAPSAGSLAVGILYPESAGRRKGKMVLEVEHPDALLIH